MHLRIAFGEFDLDEARFELRHRGQPVLVQPKVLDLICYLARHRERVVTKDELLETVWKGIAVTEASLSQAVSLARRALEDTAEDQHTIRTVRSKGLQFVAPERVGARATGTPGHRPTPPRGGHAGLTQLETVQDESVSGGRSAQEPYLFAVMHCEAPSEGGEAWSLQGVDEVEIGRGSERRSVHREGPTRVLTISVPGRLMSRRHARVVRTPHGWIVVDEKSRNGTYLNGARVEREALQPGDIVDCGRTLFRFSTEMVATEATPTAPRLEAEEGILDTVTPRLLVLERDLRRLATSDVSVMLLGEHGVGKTHVAQALHRLSGRRGALQRLDAASFGDGSELAMGGQTTLLVENIDRAGDVALARIRRLLETTEDVRLLSTSTSSMTALRDRIPTDVRTRLGAYACELPSLRDRSGDLGVLAGRIWADFDPGLEIDIAAARMLVRHDWPGNLRELAQRLKVAATLSAGAPMRAAHLFPEADGRDPG